MADRAISELVAAEQITATDMFVLEQNGTAKKLTGQILLNWLTAAAEGHGGIASIQKLKTEGLADTYRITLADTTTFDFVVNNGKGISAITKKSTSGLVDTYAITYTDGTSGSFTVTNGAKGDKGDAAYIWVKYASQEPTASSNSFGDLPDDWMGIYVGTSATAPTSYSSYKWYQIKGEKGDTGAPATLVSSSITYQVGDSGTVIPSGNWSSSIPAVTPGRYLWTRQVLQFNSGGPITSYSVSRFGIDGSGAVSTVAGIAPDTSGNVPLTASDVKALSIGGGIMEGPINMNGQAISGLNAPNNDSEAANKWYVDTGFRPITWTPTAKDVSAVPAVESEEHPGCYYRIVDNETEWLNPPCILGVDYRTTARNNGKPVYTKVLSLGVLSADKTINPNLLKGSIFAITSYVAGRISPTSVTDGDAWTFFVYYSDNMIKTACGSYFYGAQYTGYAQIWYCVGL